MGDNVTLSFDNPELAASFRANAEKRTISGIAIPWGPVAYSNGARWRFAPNSLRWSATSRVKLNLNHDSSQAIGVAKRLEMTQAGLDVTFGIARGAEGDRVLSFAEDGVLDGMSVEIDFLDGDEWVKDPSDAQVRLVRLASLRGVALTAVPAFDDARVAHVIAQRQAPVITLKKDEKMTNQTKTRQDEDEDDELYEREQKDRANAQFEAAMLKFGEQSKAQLEALGEKFSSAMLAGFEKMDGGNERRGSVRAARFALSEDPIYTFNGTGPSLVRDAWYAAQEHDGDAIGRLRNFRNQQHEVARYFERNPELAFATVNRTVGANLIPPGYRPDMYVGQLLQGRPFVDACSRMDLAGPSPFTVPKFGTITGTPADHVEGTNPTDGSLTFGVTTVTPGAISGLLKLTREIVDASNPAIDQIALSAMRESYSQQTEAKVYTLLNGASGVGGTVTTGQVPSGAYVTTATTTGLYAAIRAAMAVYQFARFAPPTAALLSQEGVSQLAAAVGTDGRPMLPSLNAFNSSGTGNTMTQNWNIDGLPFIPAWSMTGNAAGDADVIILNRSDVYAAESNLLTFRFEERSGPALIELALFGYFATFILRTNGLRGIRYA